MATLLGRGRYPGRPAALGLPVLPAGAGGDPGRGRIVSLDLHLPPHRPAERGRRQPDHPGGQPVSHQPLPVQNLKDARTPAGRGGAPRRPGSHCPLGMNQASGEALLPLRAVRHPVLTAGGPALERPGHEPGCPDAHARTPAGGCAKPARPASAGTPILTTLRGTCASFREWSWQP